MRCPINECRHYRSSIIDSKEYGSYRLRRRKCDKCKHTFTTVELLADSVKFEQGVKTRLKRALLPKIEDIFKTNLQRAIKRSVEMVKSLDEDFDDKPTKETNPTREL